MHLKAKTTIKTFSTCLQPVTVSKAVPLTLHDNRPDEDERKAAHLPKLHIFEFLVRMNVGVRLFTERPAKNNEVRQPNHRKNLKKRLVMKAYVVHATIVLLKRDSLNCVHKEILTTHKS